MRIALLGPLDVTDDGGRTLAVAGARIRALLIRLALDAGRTVVRAALARQRGDDAAQPSRDGVLAFVDAARTRIGEAPLEHAIHHV